MSRTELPVKPVKPGWTNPLDPPRSPASSSRGESSKSRGLALPVNPYMRTNDRTRHGGPGEARSSRRDPSTDRGRGRSREREEDRYSNEETPNKRPRVDPVTGRSGGRDGGTSYHRESHSSWRPQDEYRREDERYRSRHEERRYDIDDQYDRRRDDRDRYDDRRRDRYEERGRYRDDRYDDRYDERDRDSRYEDKHHRRHHGASPRGDADRSRRKVDHWNPEPKSRERKDESRRDSRKARSPSHEDGEIEESPPRPRWPPTPPSPPPATPPPSSLPPRRLTMKNRPVQVESYVPAPPADPTTPSAPPPPPPDMAPPPPINTPPPPPSSTNSPPRAEAPDPLLKTPSGPSKDRVVSRQPSELPLGPGCPVHFRRRDSKEEEEKYGRKFVGTRRLAAYDSGKILGEGTFGVVTFATEKATKRRVALKKLLVHNPRDGVSLTTVREVKLLKSLDHKNVVPILDMVVEPIGKGSKIGRQEIFMVFPFMDHDLCGLLANPKFRFGPSIGKALMKQLLEGMAYIHANNIIHRDIKTANILVDDAGQIMIADFGLARPVSAKALPPHLEDELTNMVVTRWYRAPELLLGETKYGPSIDMWSIGCILGEMYKKTPILPGGPNDVDQLFEIFGRCGPLNDETFPNWRKLPGHAGREGYAWDSKVHVMTSLRTAAYSDWKMDKGAIDLMMKLLKYDPKSRLTAEEALDHPWFYISPLPLLPKSLGVESSHEYTAKKEERQAAAQAAVPPPTRPHQRPPPQGWRGTTQQRPWPGPPNPYANGPSMGPGGGMKPGGMPGPGMPPIQNLAPGPGMPMGAGPGAMGMGNGPINHPGARNQNQRMNGNVPYPPANGVPPNPYAQNPYGAPPNGQSAGVRGTHPPPPPFKLAPGQPGQPGPGPSFPPPGQQPGGYGAPGVPPRTMAGPADPSNRWAQNRPPVVNMATLPYDA